MKCRSSTSASWSCSFWCAPWGGCAFHRIVPQFEMARSLFVHPVHKKSMFMDIQRTYILMQNWNRPVRRLDSLRIYFRVISSHAILKTWHVHVLGDENWHDLQFKYNKGWKHTSSLPSSVSRRDYPHIILKYSTHYLIITAFYCLLSNYFLVTKNHAGATDSWLHFIGLLDE